MAEMASANCSAGDATEGGEALSTFGRLRTMTCADVMTANPKYCQSSDSAARAAQIMKDEDVGPVPVVNNTNDKRVVGIVTDRDLVLEVVAQGRDARTTRLDEFMSRQPVMCRETDDAQDALEAMRNNQVRRIPVVDNDDRLVGIVAQADLARHLDEEDVGEMVEDVSQPGHNSIRRGVGRIASRGGIPAGALVAGMAVGATLMCLLDPARGQDRRARVKDAARNAYDRSAEMVRETVGRRG